MMGRILLSVVFIGIYGGTGYYAYTGKLRANLEAAASFLLQKFNMLFPALKLNN